MISTNSTFIKTDIAIHSNAVKSLVFRVTEIIFGLAIYKTFSLIAATQNSFISFLLFSEHPIQRLLFAVSRGLTAQSLLVVSFTTAYMASQLFGTVLWALDAPGFTLLAKNVTADALTPMFLADPSYILHRSIEGNDLNMTSPQLAASFSENLFRAGINASLVGSFSQGAPISVSLPDPSLNTVFKEPKLWLDSDGFAVTTNTGLRTAVIVGTKDEEANAISCPWADLDENSRIYNCTFKNEWVPALLDEVVGVPQVHWDAVADSVPAVTMIHPRARDDPWTAIAKQGALAIRLHMFTVTKAERRHTFLMTTEKATLNAFGGKKIPETELKDFIWRTASTDPAEQQKIETGLKTILNMASTAQARNQSAGLGVKVREGNQLIHTHAELLTMETSQRTYLHAFRTIFMNITLLRSETLKHSIAPYDSCDVAFANVAYGGKVVDTDCFAHVGSWRNGSRFLGQVDSSAVAHLFGMSRGGLETSIDAVSPAFQHWYGKNLEMIRSLLLSRGYLLGIDPALVNIYLDQASPAISPLQIALMCLVALCALISWGSLYFCVTGHWSSSLLINLVAVTGAGRVQDSDDPGFTRHLPDIRLSSNGARRILSTEDGVFVYQKVEDRLLQDEGEHGIAHLAEEGSK